MVGLLEADPEVGEFLSVEERVVAGRMGLPVCTLSENGPDLSTLLAEERAHAAIVLDGMLVRSLQVGEQVAIRLLGTGDIVMPAPSTRTMLLAGSHVRGTPSTRLALLSEDAVLFAVRRWPRIATYLLERFAQQSEILEAQLVISQLPRVEERLLALMWLLAERWGRVTRLGTTLPLSLTHETLGALIGARRPSVTLGLGELAERGAVIKHDHGWLLTAPPPVAGRLATRPDTCTLNIHPHDRSSGLWRDHPGAQPASAPPPSTNLLARSQRARVAARADMDRSAVLRAHAHELIQQLEAVLARTPRGSAAHS